MPIGLSLRALIIFLVVAAICVPWFRTTTRSVATMLGSTGYEMTYTMKWSVFGMKEKMTLTREGDPKSSTSTDWIEVWEKPYRSGAVVYARDDGQGYDIGIGYQLYRFVPGRALVPGSCDWTSSPVLTALAKRLIELRPGGQRADDIDPRAGRRFEELQPGDPSGSIATVSLPSKYYVDLRYLGRFGPVSPAASSNREVRFVSAESSPEPRLALHVGCP